MRRWRRAGLAVLAAGLIAVAANTYMRVTGAFLPRETPADRRAALVPHFDLRLPAGPGPHPALALFSGCDGVRDNMDTWADAALSEGWAALIVDSHTPRGLTGFEVWRLICAGQVLSGGERAGDVAVALDWLRGQPGIDAGRLALLGASHGGWAVLDFLAFAREGRRPDGLTAWPGGNAAAALQGLQGALLLYPYCGPGTRASGSGWPADVAVGMILVAGDTVTGAQPCLDLAEAMEAEGHGPDTRLMTGVTHGFDQRERSALSPLAYDAEATADALLMGRGWLRGMAAAP